MEQVMTMNVHQHRAQKEVKRYSSAIILLHWLMAIGIFLMLGSGLVMTYLELEQSFQFQLYQWHKGGGVLILLALGARIIMRLTTRAPELPKHFPRIEQLAAKLGHLGLYAAMIAMVISGWVMVSSSSYGLPTMVFGWFEWPHIPGLEGNELTETLAKYVHFFGMIGLGGLLLGHIGAVVKHRVVDNENLLTRMWWPNLPTWSVLLPVLAIVGVVVVLNLGVSSTPHTSVAQVEKETIEETAPMIGNHVYVVNHSTSQVGFSGTHAGNRFEGVFADWQADIAFNPDALDESHIYAAFMTKSAVTGNPLYDGTLPQKDWFNSEAYPKASFASSKITYLEKGLYRIDGTLTIRDMTQSVSFDATISDLAHTPILVDASFIVNRLAFGLGATSDPDANWVGKDITIALTISAKRSNQQKLQ